MSDPMPRPDAAAHQADPSGATPRNLALIGVLGVILVASAVMNFGGNNASPARAANSKQKPELPAIGRASTKTRSAASARRAEPRPRRLSKSVQWPKYAPVEAASFDPFAKPQFLQPPDPQPSPEPETTPESEPVDPRPTPEEAQRLADAQAIQSMQRVVVSLSDLGISMILSSPNGTVAQIGNREVRVGDRIEGLVVTRINMDGVELALPAEPQDKGASGAE